MGKETSGWWVLHRDPRRIKIRFETVQNCDDGDDEEEDNNNVLR